MLFSEWFQSHYRQPGEAEYRAIHRLAMQLDVGWTTVLRALKGSRVQPANAKALAAASGGQVDPRSLMQAPTRAQLKAKPSRARAAKKKPAARAGNGSARLMAAGAGR